MTIEVFSLDDSRAHSADRVGAKAATLARLRVNGLNVPGGYCVCVKHDVGGNFDLRRLGRALFRQPEFRPHHFAAPWIARSSANAEGVERSFAGVFETVGQIRTRTQLLAAIARVLSSTFSRPALEYCRLHNLDPRSLTMHVLLQKEIDGVAAGFALREVQEAKDKPGNISIELISPFTAPKRHGGKLSLTAAQRREIETAYEAVTRVFGVPPLVEWIHTGDTVAVVQATVLPKASRARPRRIMARAKRLHIPGATRYGAKGAAMAYFKEAGLFSLPLLMFDAHTPLRRIVEDVSRADFGTSGITIRFSHSTQLGLPRYFVPSLEEALGKLNKYCRPEWVTIVHPYMTVRRSFELYIDSSQYVLEHVPGLWESSEMSEPDVIIARRNREPQLLRFRRVRPARFVDITEETQVASPKIRIAMARRWIGKIQPIVERLRSDLPSAMPLVAHFVEDAQNRWNFLNIRPSNLVDARYATRRLLHVVSSTADIRTWDGLTPLLLQLPVARGCERLLTSILPYIPATDLPIYIDFGALSHPAIVLREAGLNVRPAYLSHDAFSLEV